MNMTETKVNVDKLYELSDRLTTIDRKKEEEKKKNKQQLRKLYMQHYLSHVHNNKNKHDKIVKKILSLGGNHECFANIDRGCEEW